jgi:hypothetical protein
MGSFDGKTRGNKIHACVPLRPNDITGVQMNLYSIRSPFPR